MLRIPAFLFLFCTLISLSGIAQSVISGRVVNATSQEPVAGASVFISNTSKGTVSDKNGYFELRDIASGKYDLVISSVGYETNAFSFSSAQLPLSLKVEMQVKVRTLENVVVEPSVEEGWDKWGRLFTENFLGMTPAAEQCKIKNEKNIRFRFYKKSNRIIAYCDEPIIVENRSLGYRIKYQLESFEVRFREGSSAYTGFALFEDMDEKKKEVRRRWRQSRDKAFYGSMMHFMRATYENTLVAEGFEVRRMVRNYNQEKQRVKELYRERARVSSGNVLSVRVGGNNNAPVIQSRDSVGADSSAYYTRILNQDDYTDVYARETLTADSLLYAVHPGFKEIYFPNYLLITYKKETEDPAYLAYHREKRSVTFQRSLVWLINPVTIAIYPDGSYYPPDQIFSSAYWGWSEKMAEMLPLDFRPYDKK